MTHTIRTTMRPDVEIEVGNAEYLDLKRQGLLVPAPTAAPAAAAVAPKKTQAPGATKGD